MRTMLTTNTRAARPAFTMVELMIVIIIIAVVIALGAGAYLRTIPEAEKRTAAAQIQAVAGAIQFYYQDRHDYPLMRYNDILPYATVPSPGWPNHANDPVPNAPQSIEACLYMVEYGSSGGKALQRMPAKVYRQIGSDTVREDAAGTLQTRPLHVIMDPWGNPLQYIRPRELTPYDANYPLSAGRLNNRVLLVSMGPDGVPGNGSNPANQPNWTDLSDGNVYPNPLALGQGDDIVVQVGAIP